MYIHVYRCTHLTYLHHTAVNGRTSLFGIPNASPGNEFTQRRLVEMEAGSDLEIPSQLFKAGKWSLNSREVRYTQWLLFQPC